MVSRTKAKLCFTAIFLITSLVCASLTVSASRASDILTGEERNWLREHDGKLRVGVLNNEVGFYEKDADGTLTGIAVQYIQLVEQKLDFKFKYVEYDNWQSLYTDLLAGKLDTVNFISWTKKRGERFLFTEPYFQYPYVSVSKDKQIHEQTLHTLKDAVVAVPEGYAIVDYLKQHYPGVNILTKDTYSSCVLAVAFDKADVSIGSSLMAIDLIQTHRLEGLHLSEFVGYENKHHFVVHKDMEILQSILNKGLKRITKEDHEHIHHQWLTLQSDPFYKSRTFWKYCVGVIFVVSLTMYCAVYWNRRLHQAIQRQTRELELNTELLKNEANARKRAELVLEEQEAYLQTMQESIPDLLWIKSPDGEYVSWNRKFSQIFGVSEEWITPFGDLPMISEEQKERLRATDKEVLEKSPGFTNRNLEVIERDGEKSTLEILKTNIYDTNQRLIGVLGIARDISHHQLRQQEFLSFQHLFNSILLNIQGFAYRRKADDEMSMYTLSSTVEKVTGYRKDVFLGNKERSYKSIIHPEDQSLVDRIIASRAVASGKTFDVSYRLLDAAGGSHWVVDKGTVTIDRETGETYLDGIVIDVSGHKKAEDKLRQTKKLEAIGVLSDGIALDFNNILTGISGFAQLLQDYMKSMELSEKAPRRIEQILTTVERAEKLVSQIVEFGTSGDVTVHPMNINSTVKEVAKLITTMLPDNITVTTMLAADCMILADTTKMYQILMNLGTNGGHAMKERGGTLTYSTKVVSLDSVPEGVLPGEFLRLCVADTGCGVEEAIREKILKPFYTTKKTGEGTGMGLWLVSSIVEEFNGFMDVVSVAGEGSAFTVYLPVYQESCRVDENVPAMEEVTHYQGDEHILYVDDEAVVTRLGDAALSRSGYRVSTFNDPIDALSSFEQDNDYDLIILDLNMPKMSGQVLLDKIRERDPKIKAMLITGLQTDQAVNEKFNAVLRKPISLGVMVQTVRNVLDE